MNKTQRKFLLWWLINYGTTPVDFYAIRDEYMGRGVVFQQGISPLFDDKISMLFSRKRATFTSPVSLPQHIIEKLQDETV